MPKKTAAGAAEKKTGRRKAGAAGRKKRSAPSASASSAPSAMLRVKQIRSGIGHAATYRRTLTALGLKHHQDEVLVRDVPSVQGMLRKVWNFVTVRPVEG